MAVIDGLQVYYELNESTNTDAAVDAHGSNDVAVQGTPSVQAGLVGGSRGTYFQSSANIPEVSLGSDSAFTIAFWINFTSDTTGILNANNRNGGGFEEEYGVVYNSGIPGYRIRIQNGSVGVNLTHTPTTSVWYHIIAWHDPDLNKLCIRRDMGTPAELSHSGGTTNYSNAIFGLNGAAGSGGTACYMDEYGFWNRVLTEEEQSFLYNSGAGRSYADIVAEGSGGAGDVAALVDDFNDNSTHAKWTVGAPFDENLSVDVQETGQHVAITTVNTGPQSLNGYMSTATYDLTGSYISVEIVDAPGGGAYQYLWAGIAGNDDDYVGMVLTSGALFLFKYVEGALLYSPFFTFNATDHRWWKISELNGTVTYWTSNNGTAWISRGSTASPAYLDDVTIWFGGGTNGAEAAQSMEFDNFGGGAAGVDVPWVAPLYMIGAAPVSIVVPSGFVPPTRVDS